MYLTLLLAVFASVAIVARLVWKDLVIPFRDKGLTRLSSFFDKLENFLAKAERRDTSHSNQLFQLEERFWKMDQDIEEINELCTSMANHLLGERTIKRRPARPPRPQRHREEDTPPPPIAGGS
jgi:hypothetical protein